MTLLAMLFYPGGTYTDPYTQGYSFFENFFSELGLLHTHLGGEKLLSLALFAPALVMAGIGLILFFLAFLQFFHKNKVEHNLSSLGSALGILSGLCFIGVVVPADVHMGIHKGSVMWAFRLFPAAILCYLPLLFKDKKFHRRYGWTLVAFFLLLVIYLLLLELGPGITTYAGMLIQAVGQKVIVYASILTIMFQAWGAFRRNATAVH